ncbi:MAG: nuclear transport factor 2 family protein [Bacteroidota bacterium]
MRKDLLFIGVSLLSQWLIAQSDSLYVAATEPSQQELNKEIARNFYQELWFTDNTHKYADYFANEYVVYDVGAKEGLKESAIEQKKIADFFWSNGEMSGKIDYQVADGNRVATRWFWTYKPSSLLGHFLIGDVTIPIVNVFHFENGKIVRTDNHRHDISTNRTNTFVIKGVLIGLVIGLIPTIIAFRLRRKLKKLNARRIHS